MSEYQYYEFQALDKALTNKQMSEIGSVSSRGHVTPVSYTNEYHWGDFKGDTDRWMVDYFDIFFYFANWGTRLLKFKVSEKYLSEDVVKQYCNGDSCWYKVVDGMVIITFQSELEGCDDEYLDNECASILPVRAGLLMGDRRLLYLGWLLNASDGSYEETEFEPPIPPGMKQLTPSLQAVADFLWISDELINVAVKNSSPSKINGRQTKQLRTWVKQLSEETKDDMLVKSLTDVMNNTMCDSLPILQQLRSDLELKGGKPKKRRTAGELLESAGLEF